MLNLEITEINNEHAQNAKVLASRLSNPQARKRAMIDILGINCAITYFQSKNIKVSTRRSIYKIPLLFEEFKISDLYYKNYRIDVITLYKEKSVRIPKLHYDMDIAPDFYFVVQIGSKVKEAKMIGFINSKNVATSVSDSKYYYPSLDLVFDIDKFLSLTRRHKEPLTLAGRHIDCMGLFLKFIDNDLPSLYKKQLIQHLLTCDSCRARFIDTVEFERLARNVKNHPSLIEKHSKSSSSTLEEALNSSSDDKEESTSKNQVTPVSDSIRASLADVLNENPHEAPDERPREFLNYEKEEENQTSSIIKKSLDEHPEPYIEAKLSNKEEEKSKLNKRFIETVFDDMPKMELSNIKTLVKTKKRHMLIVSTLLLFAFGTFALISFKDHRDILKQNNEMADYSEEKFFDENRDVDDFYNHTPGQAQLIPKERDINDFIIKQPISTKPVYTPNVKRISWEAPESLVKDQNYTKFLQLIGKNVKLNLQNDLLLVNDVPTSNIVNVDIKIGISGDVNSVRISNTSGSPAIDASVKKVVNDTLKYMKPPSHGLLSRSANVVLSIELN